MAYARRFSVTVTTDGSGAATAYTDFIDYGEISRISYVATDYAAGVDFTITDESTGETIWAENDVNASATRAPRLATHSTAGVAALYAAAGTAVLAPIVIVASRVKIVIASGGASKVGTFHFVVS